MMIDTHCHIFKEYYSDIKKIVDAMDGYIIVAGTKDSDNKEVIDLVNKYDKVYGVLGIQPEEIDSMTDDSISIIEDNLNNKKIIGIGEIGLDYHWISDNREKQIEVFKIMLDLARKYDKPVVIHSRDASQDTMNILREYKDLKIDLHCYSGSVELAREYVKMGVMFGIGGVLTFKNSKKLVDVVKEVPLENILLETDSPYLAPEPYRGKTNYPQHVYLVAQKIAEIKNIPVEQVLEVTTNNAIKQFDLPIG